MRTVGVELGNFIDCQDKDYAGVLSRSFYYTIHIWFHIYLILCSDFRRLWALQVHVGHVAQFDLSTFDFLTSMPEQSRNCPLI